MHLDMKAICLIVILLTYVLEFSKGEDKTSSVIEIPLADFTKNIVYYDGILVEFYNQTCSLCKNIDEELNKAAEILKNSNIKPKIGKVDIGNQAVIEDSFLISSLPAFAWFENHNNYTYNGGLLAESISTWIRRKMNATVAVVNNFELENLKNETIIVVLYGGFGSREYIEFKKAANIDCTNIYVYTNDNDTTLPSNFLRPGIAVFKKDDQTPKIYKGEINSDNILEFVNEHIIPKCIQFNFESIDNILQENKPALFLFFDNNTPSHLKTKEQFCKYAEENKLNIQFVYNEFSDDDQLRFAYFVGINEDTPSLMFIEYFNDSPIKKYVYNKTITEDLNEDIKEFISDFKAHKVPVYYKSEKPKASKDKDVTIVVRDNFKEIVGNDTDVLIWFYVPWNDNFEKKNEHFQRIAKQLKDQNLVFANCNLSLNEIEGIEVDQLQFFMFFKQGSFNGTIYNAGNKIEDFTKSLEYIVDEQKIFQEIN